MTFDEAFEITFGRLIAVRDDFDDGDDAFVGRMFDDDSVFQFEINTVIDPRRLAHIGRGRGNRQGAGNLLGDRSAFRFKV